MSVITEYNFEGLYRDAIEPWFEGKPIEKQKNYKRIEGISELNCYIDYHPDKGCPKHESCLACTEDECRWQESNITKGRR